MQSRSVLVLALPALLIVACAADGAQGRTPPDAGAIGAVGANAGTAAVPALPGCGRSCDDFPSAPIFDTGAGSSPPQDAARYFGQPDDYASTGACVLEPALSIGATPGALFPQNWLRPRFRFTPLPNENLWEIRLKMCRSFISRAA